MALKCDSLFGLALLCRSYGHGFMRIVVGQHNLNSIDQDEQVFDIEEVVKHKKWE